MLYSTTELPSIKLENDSKTKCFEHFLLSKGSKDILAYWNSTMMNLNILIFTHIYVRNSGSLISNKMCNYTLDHGPITYILLYTFSMYETGRYSTPKRAKHCAMVNRVLRSLDIGTSIISVYSNNRNTKPADAKLLVTGLGMKSLSI